MSRQVTRSQPDGNRGSPRDKPRRLVQLVYWDLRREAWAAEGRPVLTLFDEL